MFNTQSSHTEELTEEILDDDMIPLPKPTN
jgi:hypothetical protein